MVPIWGPRPPVRGRAPKSQTLFLKTIKKQAKLATSAPRGGHNHRGGEGHALTSPENHQKNKQKTSKMSNISPTRGPRPQRGRGPCPHQPRKPSKNKQKASKMSNISPTRGPRPQRGRGDTPDHDLTRGRGGVTHGTLIIYTGSTDGIGTYENMVPISSVILIEVPIHN